MRGRIRRNKARRKRRKRGVYDFYLSLSLIHNLLPLPLLLPLLLLLPLPLPLLLRSLSSERKSSSKPKKGRHGESSSNSPLENSSREEEEEEEEETLSKKRKRKMGKKERKADSDSEEEKRRRRKRKHHRSSLSPSPVSERTKPILQSSRSVRANFFLVFCRSTTGEASTLRPLTPSPSPHLMLQVGVAGLPILVDPLMPITPLPPGGMCLSMNDIAGQGKWILMTGSGFDETHLLYPTWVIGGVPLALLTFATTRGHTGGIHLIILRDNTTVTEEVLKIAATVSHPPPIIPQALEWTPAQKEICLRKGDTKTFPTHTREGYEKRRERER